jgi:hypothetical protein
LDESSFQQLLAAAFVVQQHNDGARAKDPAQATSIVLSEIAEIQSLVRGGDLDLTAAAQLTTDRLQKIISANSVAICLVMGGSLQCIAETKNTRTPGSRDGFPSIVPIDRLRAGDLFQSRDAQKDICLDATHCRERGVASVIAAPIHRFDEFEGLIEAHWTRSNAFQESDMRATRLMAGLISGVLERNARAEERRVRFSGPGTQSISETVRDQEQEIDMALPAAYEAGESGLRILPLETLDEIPAAPPVEQAATDALPGECRVCGRRFGHDEEFCGQCSMPRLAGARSEDLQSKWASLWYMQRAQETQHKGPSPPLVKPSAEITSSAPESFRPIAIPENPEPKVSSTPAVRIWQVPEGDTRPAVAATTRSYLSGSQVAPSFPVATDAGFSAARFTDASNSLTPGTSASPTPVADASPDLLHTTWQTVWARMYRRHATLALSAVGLLLLFLMLAVWPSSTNSQLTWFQSVLVELGLADVPARAPVLSGNPDVRVWVDVHTALYYCPGSDLYGKTPSGHFASQHDAQVDEFEPASRVACP